MADRHLFGGLGVGIVGEKLFDRVVEPELALSRELVDGGPGEVLVDRPQVELGVLPVGDLFVPVGKAVGLVEQDLAVLGDEDDAGELVGLGLRFEKGPGRRRPIPCRRPWDRG